MVRSESKQRLRASNQPNRRNLANPKAKRAAPALIVHPSKELSAGKRAPPPYALRITNVVCTAHAGQRVSLRLVQLACQGRLDAKVFPSNVSRSRETGTTNAIYHTGSILITGAPSIWIALLSAKQFIAKINRELHTDLRVLNFGVQNIVCSFALGYWLDLWHFHLAHKVTRSCTSHYKPEVFRGCSWILKSGLVFVLFSSGKVVLTGARTWIEAEAAYQQALPELEQYKLDSMPTSELNKRETQPTQTLASSSDSESDSEAELTLDQRVDRITADLMQMLDDN